MVKYREADKNKPNLDTEIYSIFKFSKEDITTQSGRRIQKEKSKKNNPKSVHKFTSIGEKLFRLEKIPPSSHVMNTYDTRGRDSHTTSTNTTNATLTIPTKKKAQQ